MKQFKAAFQLWIGMDHFFDARMDCEVDDLLGGLVMR